MITGKNVDVQAAVVNTTCNDQCVFTAHRKRPDLDVWAKGAGTSDAILAIAENEKPFYTLIKSCKFELEIQRRIQIMVNPKQEIW